MITGMITFQRRAKKRHDDLPGEILTPILERLPVKYIGRCMCVQKSWYYLIKSPHFVAAHLNYQKTRKYNYLLFKPVPSDDPSPLLLRVDDVQREEYRSLQYPSAGLVGSTLCGVSNGVMCLATSLVGYYREVLLWNPTIRKRKILPDPPRLGLPRYDRIILAFGFCPKANDFKVVKILKYKYLYTVADVYSLATNSWKICNNSLTTIRYVSQYDWLFLNDTAYFRGETFKGEHIIVCYDTDKDKLRRISLPKWCVGIHEGRHYSLQPYGESLALFSRSYTDPGFNVWVLNENGTSIPWEQKFRIDLRTADLLGIDDNWNILCTRSNGEVLLETTFGKRSASYNLETGDATDFEWKKRPLSATSFIESLVLMDD